MNKYSISVDVNTSFTDAVDLTKKQLKKHGFGILTTIDVKDTLRKKLNVPSDAYHILGACHPASAHKALQKEKEIGLFLPCNVIVYKNGKVVTISAVRPTVAMQMIDNPELKHIAQEVEQKLNQVIKQIQNETS